MNILIYNQNQKELKSLEDNLKKINENYIVGSFSDEKLAKQYASDNHIDVAIIDYDLVDFAKKLKKDNDKINLIFVNKNKSYQEDGLSLKASAYLFKPVSLQTLKKELTELRYPVKENEILLRIQCFGNFSVFKNNGELVKFSRAKAKEVLAYLVYKRGSDVTAKEMAAVIFEDDIEVEKQMPYLHQIYYSLNKDLQAVGGQDVLIRKYNSSSIDISKIDCDYYRFNKNDAFAKRLYNGEFMMQYEWADYVTAYLDRNID